MISRTSRSLEKKTFQGLLFLAVYFCVISKSLAAVSFVASTTVNGNANQASISIPGTTSVDDVILAQVTIRNRAGSDGVTTPSGWTLIDSQLQDDAVFQSLYYRVAQLGDAGSSVLFDFDGSGNRRYIVGLNVFSGVDTADPIEDSTGQVGMSGSNVTAPSVTTTVADSMIVTFYGLEAGNEEFFTPAGMTETYDLETGSGSNGLTVMAAYELRTTIGATGTRVSTASKSGDDAIGQMVLLTAGSPLATELAAWNLDETSWNGTAGEVIDSGVNGYNGTAINGATTEFVNPVVSGSPGTCYYGTFDDAGGTSGDYVELSSFPNLTSDFSVAAWFRTSDNTRRGQRIFADDQNNTQGFAISLGDPGTGRLRFYSRGISPVSMDTGNIISNDTWYFVVGLADITNRERTLLVYDTSGTLISTTNASYSGTWGSDSGPASIGGETNSGETGNRFFGNIDEVKVYDGLLDSSQISTLLSTTRACSIGPPTITAVSGSCLALNQITIQFNQDVESTSAQDTANYQVTNPSGASLSITSATLSSSDTVTLVMGSDLNDITDYTVTINNVENLFSETIASDSTSSFSLFCEANCISDGFSGPGSLSSDWSAGDRSGSFGDPRIVDDGFLRMTDASGNVSTIATLLNQFPGADNKVVIEFDFYAYDGSGADGIAVILSDASVSPSPGSFGGALGYAQRSSPAEEGFAGGWLGVGLDAWGNFANANEGKSGGSGFEVDSVALRGSGTDFTGYPYLTSTGTLSPGIDQSGSTRNPGHRYRITVDHTMGGSQAFVTVERDTGSGYVDIVPQFDIFAVNPSQAAVPTNWVLSFTGSTGGATNIHEIGDFKVCAARPVESLDLVDNYAISHSGTGVTCEASAVTITARDSSNNPVTVATDTSVTVSTSPAVDAIISSPAIITAGNSSTTVYLNQSSALANIDIDVTDGTATDPDDGGVDDPLISFFDTAFRFYADGVNTDTNPIGTQISGKENDIAPGNQSLTLRAVRTSTDTGECEAALLGSQEVELAYECNDPTSCSGSNLLDLTGDATETIARNNNGASLSYTTVDMTFDASGEAPFSFNFGDAGQVTLHATKTVAASSPEPAFTLSGSSNAFVVRPFGFDIDFSGQRAADRADDGAINDSTGTDTSYATNASGTSFLAAGVDFAASIDAVVWQSTDDTDNDGVPDSGANLTDNSVTPNFGQETAGSALSVSHNLDSSMPAGAVLGTFSASAITAGGGGTSFSSGTASSTFNWSEVGIIDISASLDDYLGAGDADITGIVEDVGRFTPANFSVSPNAGSFLNAGSGYTYIGQSFSYLVTPTLTVTALNASGGTTQNYTLTGYQNLQASDIHPNISFPTIDGTTNGSDGSTAMVVTNSNSQGSLPLVGAASGVMTYALDVSDEYTYTKNANSEVGPFDSDLEFDVGVFSDSDSVSSSSATAFTPDPVNLRYGRWQMENVFGPETSGLNVEAFAAYLNSSGDYVINDLDDDTSIDGLVTSSPTGTNSSGAIDDISVGSGTSDFSYETALDGGSGGFVFTAPGAGNTGSIELDVDLSGLPWLQYDWDGAGGLENHPGATATFGRYRGHDRIIYWREL